MSMVNSPLTMAAAAELSSKDRDLECAVCLQTCVLPTRLPCRHIFCFLCAKGLALQSRRCAMCRADIPLDYLDQPDLVEAGSEVLEKEGEATNVIQSSDHCYSWFYEGRNGWWQYEARLSSDLEAAYQRGERTYDALIAGSLYTLDFDNLVQLRRDDPSRRRRIKRDRTSSYHKGVAGIRQLASQSASEGSGITSVGNLVQNVQAQPQIAQAQQITQPQMRRATARRYHIARRAARFRNARLSRPNKANQSICNANNLRDVITAAVTNAYQSGYDAASTIISGTPSYTATTVHSAASMDTMEQSESNPDEASNTLSINYSANPYESAGSEEETQNPFITNWVFIRGRCNMISSSDPIIVSSDSD